MLRRAAAVIFVLVLSPAVLFAQETVLTVSVPSAEVHKGPSTITPVIGRVPRGTVLPVWNNLGSWVKVPWPESPDGAGYVHVTMGRLEPPRTPTAAGMSPRSATGAAAAGQSFPQRPPSMRTPADQMVPRTQGAITTPSHVFGLGGLVASPSTFGATARVWGNKHLGIHFGYTREATTSDVAIGRVISMQFEPGMIYSPFDHISDYIWFRPYVGSVVSFRHQTLSFTAPVNQNVAWDNGIGYRIFGGSELTFASVPRFGLSLEFGYRRFPTLFEGFEPDHYSTSIAGHWYIK